MESFLVQNIYTQMVVSIKICSDANGLIYCSWQMVYKQSVMLSCAENCKDFMNMYYLNY
jgi:hypothetical protein